MTVYLNGEFVPLAEAKISVLDRGFVYGDGVYELVPVYSKKPFRLDEHLRRLQASLGSIRLANPYSAEQWRERILKLVDLQDFPDQSVYIQVTRGTPGTADPPRDHGFPAGAAPTVFIFSQPLLPSSAAQKAAGVCAITAPDNRWLRCDIKAVSLLANILLRQQAVDVDCAETVMLRDGFLTEGAASNIFVVKGGVLLAPPPSNLMLTGITYDVVLELAAAHGIPSEVRAIGEAEVRSADELSGIRATVFLKGCPLRCLWCSNPESMRLSPEIITRDIKCIGCGKCAEKCPKPAIAFVEKTRMIDWERCNYCMKCAEVCPSRAIEAVGAHMTIAEVIDTVGRDSNYYRRTNGGMTLSGGEPLLQRQFALGLLREAKRKGFHTALDTAAYAEWEILDEILNHTDLVLYDIKHMDSEKHQEATGV